MNYYKLLYNYSHKKSDDWIFLLFDETELSFNRYDVEKSKPVEVERIYCTIAEGQTENCDYLANDLAWLVVSDKVKVIMESMNIGDCRFIEVIEKGTEKVLGYLVHCLNYIDVFDEEKAWFDRYSNGDYMVIEPAIKGEKVGGADLFKIKESNFSYFISEKLKRALQKSGAIGFDYAKVRS